MCEQRIAMPDVVSGVDVLVNQLRGERVVFAVANAGSLEYARALSAAGVRVSCFNMCEQSLPATAGAFLLFCPGDLPGLQRIEDDCLRRASRTSLRILACIDSWLHFDDRHVERLDPYVDGIFALDDSMAKRLRRRGVTSSKIYISPNPGWRIWVQSLPRGPVAPPSHDVGILCGHPSLFRGERGMYAAISRVRSSLSEACGRGTTYRVSLHPMAALTARDDSGWEAVERGTLSEVIMGARVIISWDCSAIVKAVLAERIVFRTTVGAYGDTTSWGAFQAYIRPFSTIEVCEALKERATL